LQGGDDFSSEVSVQVADLKTAVDARNREVTCEKATIVFGKIEKYAHKTSTG
jgi:hypothetical protein